MALKQQQHFSTVTFNCVYLTSTPAHKSLFAEGHLDCSKPRKKTNKKTAIKSRVNSHILYLTYYCNKQAL